MWDVGKKSSNIRTKYSICLANKLMLLLFTIVDISIFIVKGKTRNNERKQLNKE